MAIQALIPYALAAFGGYKGYRDAKDAGASGIGRILGGITGAYTGYSLGTAGLGAFGTEAGKQAFVGSQPQFLKSGIFPQVKTAGMTPNPKNLGVDKRGNLVPNPNYVEPTSSGSLLDILKKSPGGEYDPMKVAIAAGGIPLIAGAFDSGPTDVYMPGYNMGYLDMREQRPAFTYIDPNTGQEKAYEKMYAPEEAGRGDRRSGPYSISKSTFNTGGLAEIRKFNEGGINYLPSKMTHDENDSNNYVRATGYVEDGAGVGDKDEDTMLAQLADGEFVTRADGVLGAGIIAGANPNSMKDMREKGAKYFYEQQARYKRVFDLLKEKNGDSKQKTN